jgi:hypothetical protein
MVEPSIFIQKNNFNIKDVKEILCIVSFDNNVK